MASKGSISTAKKLLKLAQSEEKSDRTYAHLLSKAIDRRIALGLTQVMVGEKSGLDGKTISRIERVDTQVTAKTFFRYLNSLDLECKLREKDS
ncbi:helix-turn-helix domain-containing protein [uncultured Marinococcus sp.]|uniref:helix-turn-helix domain-containing protein n=1 Tax=uncultured Marinococcus sp. TaxID=487012 RepID=UPI002637D2DF|nr:helix-turn-helix transcriptional regulator [uncultured Marinococcus sp.]